MDNVTHTLAGLLLADAAVQFRARSASSEIVTHSASFARVAALTGAIGANLPDIDVLWGALLRAAGVYDALLALLHHRGYTHTGVAMLAGVPLLWIAARTLRSRMLAPLERSFGDPGSDSRWLLLIAATTILSHLLLDWTNDYGVHPLAPFSDTWFYGDTVFIVEPWLWTAALPMLIRATAKRWARGVLGLVLAAALLLCWVAPQVSAAAAVAVTAGMLGWCYVAMRTTRPFVSLAGIGAWLFVTYAFSIGTNAIRDQVRHAAPFDDGVRGTLELRDVIISPSPANPLCARAITVEASRETYRLTTAWAAALPSIVSAAWCARSSHADVNGGAQHLSMTPVPVRSAAVLWGATWQAPVAELSELAATQCEVAAWLRFARAPFWVAVGADSVAVDDLRYDRDRGVSVSRFTFARDQVRCSAYVPAWRRPRADIWPEQR